MNIKIASPSCPVRVLGLKVAPQVGDVLDVSKADTANMVDAKGKKVRQSGAERNMNVISDDADESEKKQILNLVIKADMLGSLEAIIGSMSKISHEEVGVKIVGKGLGNVNAQDVAKAEAAGAKIFAFNVIALPEVKDMIREKGLDFTEYKIIYDLIDYVKEELQKLLRPELIVIELGGFKVVAIFRTDKNKMIVGGNVEIGKLQKSCRVRVKRDGEEIGVGEIGQLQAGQQIMNEAPAGTECGVQYLGKVKLEKGDVLEAYKEEKKEKKLTL
jgi:translation initiation factor IF-2